jgi:hypothetical protein
MAFVAHFTTISQMIHTHTHTHSIVINVKEVMRSVVENSVQLWFWGIGWCRMVKVLCFGKHYVWYVGSWVGDSVETVAYFEDA